MKKNNDMILKLKMNVKYILSKKNKKKYNEIKNKKKIIVCLAADYGNLGDVAITYAQTTFLKKKFPDYEVVDFPISKTITELKSLKENVNRDDIITIVGGGNMGSMYYGIELCRQFVIKKFPENKIVSFPQTADFSENKKKFLKQAIQVYSKHKYLTLIAREEQTYNFLSDNFSSNTILLAPDIVLSLDQSKPYHNRRGILTCLRNDKEQQLDTNVGKIIFDLFNKKYQVTEYDTLIEKKNMSINERENELEEIWEKFKKSRLVITDRLHGMIFCHITDTPCIAINNSNKKVSRVYNLWLKNNKEITMINNFEGNDIEDIIQNRMDEEYTPILGKRDLFDSEFERVKMSFFNK